jgi:hypothetical protein
MDNQSFLNTLKKVLKTNGGKTIAITPIEGFNVKITKVDAVRFGDAHPNGINNGYTQIGLAPYNIEIGLPVYIGSLRTSQVTEIVNENTFKTKNSVYQIEVIPMPASLVAPDLNNE